jgi:hypothetical protein
VPLLPSGPGGVRGLPLRRTRLSSASASFLCSYDEYIRVSASAPASFESILFSIHADAVRPRPSY